MAKGQLEIPPYQNLLGIFLNFFDFKLNCARSVGFSEVHLVVAAVVLGSGRPVCGGEGGREGRSGSSPVMRGMSIEPASETDGY